MINQTYADIVTPELLTGAIENNEYEGFLYDYHVLHCLIRKYKPTSILEIGCNLGTGTNIICNAGSAWLMKVYSLDLPQELAHISLQSPISEGKGDKVGINCKFAFTLIREDSMKFDFSAYPVDAYYCDGEHTTENVFHETREMLSMLPKIIIYHDSNLPEVMLGITDGLKPFQDEYDLYRVTDTRISYLLKRNT